MSNVGIFGIRQQLTFLKGPVFKANIFLLKPRKDKQQHTMLRNRLVSPRSLSSFAV